MIVIKIKAKLTKAGLIFDGLIIVLIAKICLNGNETGAKKHDFFNAVKDFHEYFIATQLFLK